MRAAVQTGLVLVLAGLEVAGLAALWPAAGWTSPVALAAPAPAPPGPPAGRWRWPLPVSVLGKPGSPDLTGAAGLGSAGRLPEVTRGFRPPRVRYGRGHRGVDLAAVPGTPVLAAGAGVVGYAGPLAGRGVVTVVHRGGLRTTYEPVHPTVRVGQRVTAGTVLGTVEPGHPGCPRTACLHWGLLRGAVYLDPLSLLRTGPVRLLPLATPAGTGPDRPAALRAASWPGSGGPEDPPPPWTRPGTVAALGLAAAGALIWSARRRP